MTSCVTTRCSCCSPRCVVVVATVFSSSCWVLTLLSRFSWVVAVRVVTAVAVRNLPWMSLGASACDFRGLIRFYEVRFFMDGGRGLGLPDDTHIWRVCHYLRIVEGLYIAIYKRGARILRIILELRSKDSEASVLTSIFAVDIMKA